MVRPRWMLAGVLLAAVLLQVSPAVAGAPANDVIGGAVTVDAIPFDHAQDTTEATTDDQDIQLNEICGAPATDASVWFSFTPASDGNIMVDVSQSNYSAGVLVGTGSPGSLELHTCGPQTVGFPVEAGTTYFILAIDDQFDGGGNGGQLEMTIDLPPPPPEVTLTVDPVARLQRSTGAVDLRGTVTCVGEGVQFALIEGRLEQRVSGQILVGFFFTEFTCDGSTQPWGAKVAPERGRFVQGGAVATANALACTILDCGETSATQRITIVRA